MFGTDDIYLTSADLPVVARLIMSVRRFFHEIRTGHEITTVRADGLRLTYCSTCARDHRITVLGLKTLTSKEKK